VSACESGEMEKALELLSEAIQVAPNRPSPYNNRAQVRNYGAGIPFRITNELSHCGLRSRGTR